jgi:hypothetical protein
VTPEAGLMLPKPTPALSDLYAADEVAWLDAMVELLDLGAHDALDFPNLREFLNDMAGKDRREVTSRLVVLLAHILKWEHQPGKRTEGWRNTIFHQQTKLRVDTAGGVLRVHALDALAECYESAVTDAARQTSLPVNTFPAACPYTLEQALAFTPPPLGDES